MGKTTLACNFASFLAKAGRRVLVLDLDPQCNSTQLLLPETLWEGIYGDTQASSRKSILSLFNSILEGDSSLNTEELPLVESRRFSVMVLPGHPSLSTLEDTFSASWVDFRGGQLGPARRTAWLRYLVASLQGAFDVVVIDVSPSLGALNRTSLLGSDYFVTPMAPDLFSLFALDNISVWFERWIGEYAHGWKSLQSQQGSLPKEVLPEDLAVRQGFLGYTVQQYVTKTRGGGERRAVVAYDTHRAQIPARAEGLTRYSRYSATELDLGTVPNMFAMVPLAQSAHSPISGLSKEDGIRGSQISQHQRYVEQLSGIFERLESRAFQRTAQQPL